MRLRLAILFILSPCLVFAGNFYQTAFPGTENPISESSKWSGGHTTGLDWQDCKTTGGSAQAAFGSGSVNDDDATAICTGFSWGNDQIAAISLNANTGDGEECEIRLRSAVSAHSCTGYEINWNSGAYIQIVQWLGSINSFNIISNRTSGVPTKHAGDVLYCKVVGTTISVYINGTLVSQVADSMFSSGKPGFGFFGTMTGQSITNFAATDGSDPEITVQPQGQTVNVGQTATFAITADGLSALTYQWKFNGSNVSTASSYARTNCQLTDSGGSVTCVVADTAGNVTSSTATLTVNGGTTPAASGYSIGNGTGIRVSGSGVGLLLGR